MADSLWVAKNSDPTQLSRSVHTQLVRAHFRPPPLEPETLPASAEVGGGVSGASDAPGRRLIGVLRDVRAPSSATFCGARSETIRATPRGVDPTSAGKHLFVSSLRGLLTFAWLAFGCDLSLFAASADCLQVTVFVLNVRSKRRQHTHTRTHTGARNSGGAKFKCDAPFVCEWARLSSDSWRNLSLRTWTKTKSKTRTHSFWLARSPPKGKLELIRDLQRRRKVASAQR